MYNIHPVKPGYDTASLVATARIHLLKERGRDEMAMTRPRWTHSLGLDPSVTSLNVCSYSTSAFFSIAFLVFINSQTPFVLTNVLHVPTEKIAQITGYDLGSRITHPRTSS